MRVVNYQSEIKQTEIQLRRLEKRQSNAKLPVRVQLLRLLKSGEFSQLNKVVKFLGITEKHGCQLWKKYKMAGLDGYLRLNYQGKSSEVGCRPKSKVVGTGKRRV